MRRKYKVYSIEEMDNLDWSKFTQSPETCLKSVDNTKFIIQFKYKPAEGESGVLSNQEAIELKHTSEWKDPANEGLI